MKRRFLPLWAAVLAVMIGLVPGALLATTTIDTAERAMRYDPDAGRTEAEQLAAHEQAFQQFLARRAAWLEGATRSRADFHAVPRVHASVLVEKPQPSLEAAVRAADVIVVGQVTGVEFTVDAVSIVSFRVDRQVRPDVAAGQGPLEQVTILQAGGPEPADAEWNGLVLSEAEGDPLLLSGDRAMLFLKLDGQRYYVLPASGHYRLSDRDRVQALDENPFRARLNGSTLEEAIAVIRKAASR